MPIRYLICLILQEYHCQLQNSNLHLFANINVFYLTFFIFDIPNCKHQRANKRLDYTRRI